MLDVDKNYCDSAYIDSYWKNNLVLDQSKTIINIEDNKKKVEDVITRENNLKLKYNNKHLTYNTNYQNDNYDNFCKVNEQYKTYKKYDYKNKYNNDGNNQYNSNNQCRIKEHHNNGRRVLLESYSKPKLLNVNQCRIKEYHNNGRRVLLESFSKPKLLYNSNIKN